MNSLTVTKEIDMDPETAPAAEPVDSTAPSTDAGQAPAAEPKYVADDYVIPADDEAWPKALRGKPVSEAKVQAARWEHEVTTANAQNREDRKEQREIWRALLDRTTPKPEPQPRQPMPQIYRDNGDGTVVPVALDQLLEPFIRPLRDQLAQVNDSAVFGSLDQAREMARMQIPGMDPQTWNEMAPEFGAIMKAHNLDGRDPNVWIQVHNYLEDRAQKRATRVASAARVAPPPVGNATSQGRGRDRDAFRLSAEQKRHADSLAADMGLSPDSKDPKIVKQYKEWMKEAEAHYSERGA